MANIQEKIAKLYPEATVEQADTLTITVDDAKWHALATTLRDDCAMDYLITIVGMDWKESLGCIYYLMSSKTNRPRAPNAPLSSRPLACGMPLRT